MSNQQTSRLDRIAKAIQQREPKTDQQGMVDQSLRQLHKVYGDGGPVPSMTVEEYGQAVEKALK